MRRSGVPTTEDVARVAGVSRATVSFVLNQRADGRITADTQARVLRAAQSLGYRRNRLATALSTGRAHAVGIVSEIKDFSDVAASADVYLKNVFLAVTLAAARAGLNAFLLLETPDLELRPEDVADGRVDGVIVFRMQDNDSWVPRVEALGLPCVEIGSCCGRYWVDVDNAGGAALAVEHLCGLGHRRIAYFARRPSTPLVPSPGRRLEGFRAAVTAAGIPDADAPVACTPEELGRLFGPDVAPDRRPTAVFCFSDGHALTALDLLTARGLRVPEDVSLVGFNSDVRAESVRPALTSVVNPVDEMARAAIGLLRRQMEGSALPEEGIVLPARLAVRQSTAAPSPER